MRLIRRLRRWARVHAGALLPFVEPPWSKRWSSWDEWRSLAHGERDRIYAQFRLQSEVAQASGDDGWPGWCALCQAPVRFDIPSYAAGALANLREELACPGCRLTSRNRAALALLCEGQALDTARIYLTEQASHAFVWLQRICPRLEGSEFGLDGTTRSRLWKRSRSEKSCAGSPTSSASRRASP